MSTRPQLYLNFDPIHDFLLALEFGRIDEGQPEGSWEGRSRQLGFLHDGPDARCLGFRLQDGVGAYDPDAEEHEDLWRQGPRFDVPLLGLRDVPTNEVIVAALAHFDGRPSHNRELFHQAMAEEDLRKAFGLWQRCLEAGDAMAHYALGYTAFELERFPQAYRHLRHYAELAPCEPWAHAWYGRAAGVIGERTEAYEAFGRAMELDEDRDEPTEAVEWLEAMDAPSRLEELMAEVADDRALAEWEGDARVGGDPRLLLDWPGGPVLAELDLDGGADGVAFLQVDIGVGPSRDLPSDGRPGPRWLFERDGHTWLAMPIGGPERLSAAAVGEAADELVDRALDLRASAQAAGFGPPLAFAAAVEELQKPAAAEVVYGEAMGGLVFAQPVVAAELAATWAALNAAGTWGELEAALSPKAYAHCLHFRVADDDEVVHEDADAPPEPAADRPFDTGQVSTIGDGDFPPNPVDLVGEWMPDEVLALCELQRVGMIGRDWVLFDEADEAVLLAALREHGFRVRRDDALIGAACGA